MPGLTHASSAGRRPGHPSAPWLWTSVRATGSSAISRLWIWTS